METPTQSKNLWGARSLLVTTTLGIGTLMASGQTPVQAEISISIDRACKGVTPAVSGTVQTLRGDDPRLGAMDYGWGPAAKELDRLARYTGGLPHGPSRAHILHTDTGRLLH